MFRILPISLIDGVECLSIVRNHLIVLWIEAATEAASNEAAITNRSRGREATTGNNVEPGGIIAIADVVDLAIAESRESEDRFLHLMHDDNRELLWGFGGWKEFIGWVDKLKASKRVWINLYVWNSQIQCVL